MRSLKTFLKTVTVTVCCILFLSFAYLGVVRIYESMQSILFADDRAAVVIGEDYIKFFDIEIYF